MLGLGAGLSRSSVAPEATEILVYASDFTSDVDGWANWGAATTNVNFNQTAPDLSTGWLKQTFVSAIPASTNIGLQNSLVGLVPDAALGLTYWRFTGKGFFEETSGEWGGAVSSARISFAQKTTTRDFDVNTVVAFNVTNSGAADPFQSSESAFLYLKPDATTVNAGAKVYWKDLRIYAVLP